MMSVWFQMQRDGREAKIARRIGRAKTWNWGQLNKVQAGCHSPTRKNGSRGN